MGRGRPPTSLGTWAPSGRLRFATARTGLAPGSGKGRLDPRGHGHRNDRGCRRAGAAGEACRPGDADSAGHHRRHHHRDARSAVAHVPARRGPDRSHDDQRVQARTHQGRHPGTWWPPSSGTDDQSTGPIPRPAPSDGRKPPTEDQGGDGARCWVWRSVTTRSP